MKLRTQIPTLIVPFTVVPLLVLGWIAFNQLWETSEQRVFGEMRAAMDQLRAHVDTELSTATANIELFARHTFVKKYVLTEDEDQRYSLMMPPLLRLLQSYQEAFPNYYEIRIFLPDGYEDIRQTSHYIKNLTDEEAENPVFQKMARAGGRNYTAIFRNPDNQEVSLFVGKPLVLRDPSVDAQHVAPKLRGYLALTIKLQKLADLVESRVIGREGYLFATDPHGNVLIQSGAAALDNRVPQRVLDGAPFIDAGATAAKMSFNGRASFLQKSKLHPDLYLFAVLPEDELLSISRNLAVAVAAITLFTIAVTSICLIVALGYLVVKPIHRLGVLSKQIGRGEWNIKSGMKSNNEIGELARSFEDMASNLKRSDEQIRYFAYHDNLTGLPNRVMFSEYLGVAIARARRNRERLAVLFLDIDDFKRVNDTLGHQSGDALLQEVTDRLSRCLRESDYLARHGDPDRPACVLARHGGDEFIILLPQIKHLHDPSAVAQRIIEALSQPITIKNHEYYVGASIGITLYPNDGDRSDELIKNADSAMYHAKEQGKNGYMYFQDSMNAAAFERLALENRLRRALKDDQLTLHYQAQLDAKSREVIGLEALLRWHDPGQGMISPGEFITLAEQTGLIIPLGEWVLNKACRQAVAWQSEGCPPVRISVNVSAVQFDRGDFVATLEKALVRSRLDPGCLEIEITENAIISNPKGAVDVLAAIKALGVSIALDDFGKSYSSLNYLRRFPIDTLKIDRSFIMDVENNREDEEIVGAIVTLAHALNLRVVAEGVETSGQLRVVTNKGCDLIQGFLFSRPAPPDRVFDQFVKPMLRIS